MIDSPVGYVEAFEDFIAETDPDGTDVGYFYTAAGVGAPTLAILAEHGGWVRADMGAAEDEAFSIVLPTVFEVDEGSPVVYECRFKTSVAASSSIFVGFSDATGDTVIIEDEDGTLNTVATDAVGVLIEGEQDLTPQLVGVDTDSDKTQTVLDTAKVDDLADDTKMTVRIELAPQDGGTVRVYINGELGVTATNYFDTSMQFYPVVSCDSRNTAYNFDLDYIRAWAPRS